MRMIGSRIGIVVWLWLSLSGGLLLGQEVLSRQELESRIELTDRLLSETRNREARSLVTLRTLNRQIAMRRQLIERLGDELTQQLAEIERLDLVLCEMEGDKERILTNYQQALRTAYREMDSDNIWMAILSAHSLSDAYYRLQYYRQFTTYCQQQLALIERTQGDLETQAAQLTREVQEKDRILAHRQDELVALEQNRQEQRGLYRDLKKRASHYQNLLAEERNQLQSLIREAENVYQASHSDDIANNYAESFTQRRGQLPWPVQRSRSLIVGHFGRDEDPFGNPITNDGIYLRTPEGEEVHAVHAGRVTGLTHLPLHGGWVVIVEHGRYRTVYANLEKVFVAEGQLLASEQTLGLVRTDHRTGETVLHFLLYTLPNRFVDPERWLAR